MAILKSNERNEGSGFSRFAATSALGVGVGIGAYRNREALKQAFSSSPDVTGQTTGNLGGVGRINTRAPVSSQMPVVSDLPIRNHALGGQYNIVSGLDKYAPKLAAREIASSTYEALVSSGRVSPKAAQKWLVDIRGSGSAKEAYEMAQKAIQSTGSNPNVFFGSLDNAIGSGVYSPTRQFQRNTAYQATGSEFRFRKPQASFSALSPGAQQTASRYIEQLKSGGQNLGATVGDVRYFHAQQQVGSKTVKTPMMRFSLFGTESTVPLEATGATFSGKNLTTRYVTRRLYDPSGKGFVDYGDHYINELSRTMAQAPNISEAKREMHHFHVNLVNQISSRDQAARAASIFAMPDPALTAGGRASSRLNLYQAANIYGRPVLGEEATAVFGESIAGGRQLWPYTSPQAQGKGTLFTRNVAQGLFGDLSRWSPVERNPLQFIRGEWGVTAEAKAAAPAFTGEFGQWWDRLDPKVKGVDWDDLLYGKGLTAESRQAYSAPQLVTMYMRPDETGVLKGLAAEEMGLVSQSAADMMEYERVRPVSIALGTGQEMDPRLAKMMEASASQEGKYLEFQKPIGRTLVDEKMTLNKALVGQEVEALIGAEAKTGRTLFTETGEALSTEVIGVQATGDDVGKVFLRERHRLTSEQLWKLFGLGEKHLVGVAGEAEFQKALELSGAGRAATVLGQAPEMALAAGTLQKNPHAVALQQISAMSMISANKVNSRALEQNGFRTAKQLLENPAKFLGIGNIVREGVKDQQYLLTQNMVRAARTMGFTGEEMAMTFGLTPQGLAERVFTEKELAVVTRPGTAVAGISGARLGDLASEGGAGKLASFEPTGLRLLGMKGEAGQSFAAELVGRATGAESTVAADKMLASMLNQADPTASVIDRVKGLSSEFPSLSTIVPEEIIAEEGRYLDVGKKMQAWGGSSRLYVPGRSELPETLSAFYPMTGDRPVVSDLEREYISFSKMAQRKDIAEEELEAAAKSLRKTAQVSWAEQSIVSGKILGTRQLTAIAGQGDSTAISSIRAEQMYSELIEATEDAEQRKFLLSERQRALTGKPMTGVKYRHPLTGPESLQVTKWHVDPNLADDLIAVPTKKASITIGGQTMIEEVSDLVGMKADFDNDKINIGVISSKNTRDRAIRYMANQSNADYTKYLFNHYAMKSLIGEKIKEDITQKSLLSNLVTGTERASRAKVATGEINLALQQMKQAVAVAAPEEYRPLAELFWHVEEAAIGGKHGGRVQDLHTKIAMAGKQKSTGLFKEALVDLMGEEKVTVGGVVGGRNLSWTYDPDRISEKVIGAMKATESGVTDAHAINRLAKNRIASENFDDALKLFNARQASVDVGQSLRQTAAYGEGNLLGRAGKKLQQGAVKANLLRNVLKKAAVPIGIGAVAAAGIMLAAPSTTGTLASTEGPAGGRNIVQGDQDMYTSGGLEMRPPPPRIMESPKLYDIGRAKTVSRANINFKTRDMFDSNRDIMLQAQQVAEGSNTRINIRDNRSLLDPHLLAQKLHERL